MDDKQFKEQRKRIRKLWAKWRDVLGLYAWHVDLKLYRGPFDLEGEVSDAVGAAEVNWQYLRATLRFNLVCFMNEDDAYIEEVFVHECVHILVREMRQDWMSDSLALNMPHEERVTTVFARALVDANRVAG